MRNIDSERFGQEVVTGIGRDLHLPQGKALDLVQSSTIESFNANIQGSTNYKEMRRNELK